MMNTDSRPVLRIINNTLLILCNTINIVLIIMMSTDSRPVLRIINNTLLILCNTINIVLIIMMTTYGFKASTTDY